MRTIRTTIIFFLLFALSSCTYFNQGKISQDALPWNESGEILLEDDFSDESTGWEVVSNVYELKGYSTNGYMISINQPGSRSISTTSLSFSDTIIDVEVQKITGARESQFGLVCRYQDMLNFYGFVISADGYAGIVLVLDGQASLLGSKQFIRAEGINLDDGFNRITATCQEDNLRLDINGKTIVRAKDKSFTNGQNGLLVETFEEKNSTIVFNNLIVVKP